MEVLDYVYYRRERDDGDPYVIACLVADFTLSPVMPDYLPTALFVLESNNRTLISDIARDSTEGRRLLENLESIVALRNEQARRQNRQELPAP